MAILRKFIVVPFLQEKKLLLIIGSLILVAYFLGYGLGFLSTRIVGVHDHQSAKQLMQWSNKEYVSSASVETNVDSQEKIKNEMKKILGNQYSSMSDSWGRHAGVSIIYKNIFLATILAIFSVIPLTATWAIFKELEIEFMMGMSVAWNAAVNGNIKAVLAMPHFFLETPATLLVTTLCARSAIMLFKKKYGQTVGSRIRAAYMRWVYAAPILLFLFVAAGLVEAYLTPRLVNHWLVLK